MYINAATETSPVGEKSMSATSVADGTQTFLTLLMTQLKTQDPLSPMDPTQMVTQLAQFNSLSELMQIRQLLEVQVNATNSNGTGAQTGAGGQ